MKNISIYDNYTIDFKEFYKTTDKSYYLIYSNKKLVLNEDKTLPFLTKEEVESEFNIKFTLYIGTFYNKDCFVALTGDCEFNCYSLKDVYTINEELYLLAGRGIQIVTWYKNHQYCGGCGKPNIIDNRDMMLKCPECGIVNYTRIAPAIIVAIKKDDKLLMAHNSEFGNGIYALIAGFVEAGESLEEAVCREVHEEIGINIKDITYFNSQAWPFPNSLMLGFKANYDSGEIKVDNFEIKDANWFKKDEVKKMRNKVSNNNISISSWLMDDFIENN